MEELMNEIHAVVSCDPVIKGSQVFLSTVEQLLQKGSERKMARTRCWATPQRWLFTLDLLSLSTTLWNPSNQEKVELPSMKENLPKNCKCLLSHDPKSAHCVVLVLDADEPVLWFCLLGGKEWTRHDYNIFVKKVPNPFMLTKIYCSEDDAGGQNSCDQTSGGYIIKTKKRKWRLDDEYDTGDSDDSERFLIQSIAAVEGKFYFDISPSKLGVLELCPHVKFSAIEFEKLYVPWNCWELARPHLFESCGRLFLMLREQRWRTYIYQLDFSKLAWSEVDRLDGQVFFLGKLHFTASFPALELGLEENNIYYLRENGLLAVYFLGDKYQQSSTYCSWSVDDLSEPLLSIRNVLSKAYGFAVGCQTANS